MALHQQPALRRENEILALVRMMKPRKRFDWNQNNLYPRRMNLTRVRNLVLHSPRQSKRGNFISVRVARTLQRNYQDSIGTAESITDRQRTRRKQPQSLFSNRKPSVKNVISSSVPPTHIGATKSFTAPGATRKYPVKGHLSLRANQMWRFKVR